MAYAAQFPWRSWLRRDVCRTRVAMCRALAASVPLCHRDGRRPACAHTGSYICRAPYGCYSRGRALGTSLTRRNTCRNHHNCDVTYNQVANKLGTSCTSRRSTTSSSSRPSLARVRCRQTHPNLTRILWSGRRSRRAAASPWLRRCLRQPAARTSHSTSWRASQCAEHNLTLTLPYLSTTLP